MFIPLHFTVRQLSRLGRAFICGLLGWWLAQAAVGAQTIPEWFNTAQNLYTVPGTGTSLLPQINATAFYNDSVFSIAYSYGGTTKFSGQFIFNPQNTLYYTNDYSGYIEVNNPNLYEYNVGFEFDLNGGSMAGTFNNQGTIHCDSVQDNNIVVIANGWLTAQPDYGECIVNATNIINPGTIEVGDNGVVQMTGQNVDLTRSVLNVENTAYILDWEYLGKGSAFGYEFLNNLNFTSTGAAGLDTNGDWVPGAYLAPTYAYSSYPDYLYLTNSLPYFKVDQVNPSNVIYRAVFVQNNSPNAPYSVYIDPPNSSSGLDFFAAGAAHVCWAGFYTDPSTGITTTNYLYLTDDYLLGASTNVIVAGGVPDNFTFLTSAVPLLFGPINSGYLNVFPDIVITNRYAYMNGMLAATSVNTNQNSGIGGLPVLPNRIQITANNHLNLTGAIITGQNYLSLTATNQFDGSGGAVIASPYSDLNLGSTNGFMTVSNLLEAGIPTWSGIIDAWSTRWTNVDAVTGITNDYRVLMVNSQLQPTFAPWVHNLSLHATNSLCVNDVLNVYGILFFDARSLTLATNLIGYGATSFDGELNAYFPGSLGPAQWPNLLYLTNNGAIRSQNQIIFTNVETYGAVINNGLIMDQGAIIYATNFVSGGVITNGVGNFIVQSRTTTLTNGYVAAGGSISITASKLVISNVPIQCLSLTLNPTNLLTDGGPSTNNGNIWTVGYTNATSGGLALLHNPANGDLLGTTITNICPGPNKRIVDTWAGNDFGLSPKGYYNNAALGRLILDVEGGEAGGQLISFGGVGASNALYVDSIEVRGVLTNCINGLDTHSVLSGISYDFSKYLAINTNLVIYFAQAYWNGYSIAEAIESASLEGGNGGNPNGTVVPGRLRWVPTYAGFYSSTNLVAGGVTNTVNAALAASADIDSNGSGYESGGVWYPTYNNSDPASHIFVPSELNFSFTTTNKPSRRSLLTWNTFPYATNYVYYTSSLLTNNWSLFTNFTSTEVFGPAYPVSVLDATDTNVSRDIRFYRVEVAPLSADEWLLNPPQ